MLRIPFTSRSYHTCYETRKIIPKQYVLEVSEANDSVLILSGNNSGSSDGITFLSLSSSFEEEKTEVEQREVMLG